MSSTERGNALFYILIAVALLGALSASLMRGGGDQASAISAQKISEDLRAQAQGLRSAIQECVLAENAAYPAQVAAPHYADTIQCVGDTTKNVFGGIGYVVPVPPVPFMHWLYLNDGTDVYFQLTVSTNCSGNTGLSTAISYLTDQYADEEFDATCNGTTADLKFYVKNG